MINLRNLTIKKDNTLLLKEINISFKSGNTYLLSGNIGTGKTTILNIISGLDKQYHGTIIKEQNITISYLFIDSLLFEQLTVKDNIIFYQKFYKIPKDKFNKYLNNFDLTSIINKKVGELSTGNKQLVAIICTLMNQGKLILLDEPTTNLDHATITMIIKYLKKIKHDKIIIIASHQGYDLKPIIDQYLHIDNQIINISNELL